MPWGASEARRPLATVAMWAGHREGPIPMRGTEKGVGCCSAVLATVGGDGPTVRAVLVRRRSFWPVFLTDRAP
jgi:hypothetical protein